QFFFRYSEAKTEHHIVSGEIRAGEVIVIKVLPDTVKLACCDRQTQPQFRHRQRLKCGFQRYVCEHAPSRHKPVTPRRAVGSCAKQKLAASVLDNKVERDKRGGAHYRGKVFLT